MSGENHEEETEKVDLLYPALVVMLVLGAWILTWLLLKDVPERGTFGDMFGSVNSLFSGLAFVGVVFAIILQGKELKLQRRELKFTRDELKGQKLQLEAQNSTLRKQNFENTFFELLRLLNEITNSIDLIDENNKITKGRDCFQVFYKRFKKLWGRNLEQFSGASELERINNTYLAFYEEHQSEFGHYFRSMYNIVKFVDNSPVENKRLYTNLVRAQISSFELALLFYNSLSDMGREKFKPLIEEYSLLKTVPRKVLLNPSDHLSLYSGKAYGDKTPHNTSLN